MKNALLYLCAMFTIAIVSISCTNQRKQRTVEILEKDTIEQFTPPTVQEVLQWRESMRLEKYTDSVFLAMPTQVLTQILVTKGTELSNEEIVAIYINNKDLYDNLIKKSMDIQKQYIPDSMPRSSLPEPNSDSVHAALLHLWFWLKHS